ncbi:protein TPX2-like isoform X3 [Cucumis melo]|uniref:Protein TPX2-like isoform X3 n=1 Tax=Cucumis melo TaxID=3656 RepID=A0ABM3KGG0_CUCME|nr:protein TPX2-like isoform X3 [Cucumis melo]
MEKEMETDEEMKEVYDKPFVWEEIDLDYEFDVAMYYDFTRPETEKEIKEAEDWFKFAGTYPPSPFVLKLKGEEEVQAECNSMELKNVQNHWDDHKNSEINENDPDILGINLKSTIKVNPPRCSTFMKPTASYLAKQNQPRGIHSNTVLRRFQFSLGDSIEISSQRSSLNISHATKRQKLEAGYFSNVRHSKRQTSLLHKIPKKVVSEVFPPLTKIKATIPREPNLETANRAQRDRSKIDMTTTEHNKLDASNFKARPLNRKILEAPTLLPPKKSIPQMPEFQVFHLKTSERAAQHTYVVSKSLRNSQSESKCTRRPSPLHDMKQEKCVKAEKCKARPLDKMLSNNEECDVFVSRKDGTSVYKEFNCLDQKRCSDELPTKLLSKLTLSSDCNQCGTKFHCKMHFPDNILLKRECHGLP